MARTRRRVLLCSVVCAIAAAAAARAQSNDEINSGIQFNFSTPGARSLGLGGAFLALADDATAAYANPAGLTNLTVGGPEVSIELRNWGFTNRFNAGGRSSGSATGIGLDTLGGIEAGESSSETQGLSFASLGYVLPRGATLALYRHQLADFQAELDTEGIFVGSSRTNPASSRIDLDIASYGAAVAYAFAVPEPAPRRRDARQDAGPGGSPSAGERGGSLSLGLALSYYRLELDSLTRRFGRRGRSPDCRQPGDPACLMDRQPGGFYGPADRLDDNVLNLQSQHGDDAALGFNAGLLWHVDSARRWSLGAVYRRGPGFDVTARRERPAHDPATQGIPDTLTAFSRPARMRVPDVLGLGVAWSAAEGRTKVLLDLDRVRYSQLTERLVNLFTVAEPEDLKDFRIDDGQEVHLGFEHVLPLAEPRIIGTLRLGAWYDPAHSLEYRGNKSLIAVRFPGGTDEVHYAAGAGLVFQENFQVDAAVDLSERVDTVSVSVVKFF